MESVGARLKKIRLGKGLTLEEVHKKTKIHLNVLKAMEEDSLINVSPVYVKGFLKMYCKFLEVEPKDFIPDYKEGREVLMVASGVESNSGGQSGPLLKTAPLKTVPYKLPIKPKAIAGVVLAIVCVFVVFNIGKFIFSRRSRLPRKPKPVAVAAPRTVKKTVAVKPRQPSAGPKAQAPAATVQPNQPGQEAPKEFATGIRLAILAKEDCWINLKSDGKVVFHGSLKKGRTETWQAKEKLELSVNNAGVLNLEVNGKLITNLGRRGQALRNIVITREGMTIGQ